MEQPYMNMMEPNKKDYEARTRDICLFSYYEHFHYDERFDDEDDEEAQEEKENHRHMFPSNDGPKDGVSHWYSGYRDQPPNPKLKLKDVTLQTLLDFLPAGVAADQVHVTTTVDVGDMGVYGHEVCFYYKATLPDEPEQYQEDMKIWRRLRVEWERKEREYQEWQKAQEVKELEEKIARLKR